MTTETPAPTDELLGLPLRDLNVTLEKAGDMASLRALADAEINGEKRTNVLNVIQKHLGRVAMEMPEAPTEVPFDPAALFDASIEAGMDTDIEDLLKAGANAEVTDSPISSGTVQHSRPAKVLMYAPAPDGYRPLWVARGNAKGNYQNQGYLLSCPDCKRRECSLDGNLNDCPGRPARAFAWCPVCSSHRVWDPKPTGAVPATAERETEEGEVRIAALENVTSEQRVSAQMEMHMYANHPDEARAAGMVAQSPRDRFRGGEIPVANADRGV